MTDGEQRFSQVDAVEVKELFHRTLELQQSLVKSLSEVSDSIKDGIAAAQLFARTLAETQEFLDSVKPLQLPGHGNRRLC